MKTTFVVLCSMMLFAAGCSTLKKAAGGNVPNIEPAASKSGGSSIADKYTTPPKESNAIRNLRQESDFCDQEIKKVEAEMAKGGRPDDHAITGARICVGNHFYHIVNGGTFGQCDECKMELGYLPTKEKYPGLEQRLSAIEKKWQSCTWGFKMHNGELLRPDLKWSPEDFKALGDKSKGGGTMRCWSDKDPESWHNK